MAFPFVVLSKLTANAAITQPNYLHVGFREFLVQSPDNWIPLPSVNK